MRSNLLVLWLAAVVFTSACGPQPANVNQTANSNTTAANPKWDAHVEQFLTDYFTANPHFAVYQGRHEFDGKLPDWRAAGIGNEIARLKSERGRPPHSAIRTWTNASDSSAIT